MEGTKLPEMAVKSMYDEETVKGIQGEFMKFSWDATRW